MAATTIDILIVEDNANNAQLLEFILADAGYSVAAANTGQRGLELVQTLQPDLILLDVMLPDITGFDCCKRLKLEPTTRDIPIIFLTGQTEYTDEAYGLSLGAVDYILKPIVEPVLLARVRTHLSLRRQQQELEQIVSLRTDALNKALREVAKGSRMKDEFLSLIGHEMRTPINGITGSLELLNLTSLDSEQQQLVQLCNQSSHELQHLVENILLLTEAISGTLKKNDRIMDVRSVFKLVASYLRPRAEAKGVKLTTHVAPSVPQHVCGDSALIARIYGHLLENAVKFTHQGEVRLEADYYEEQGQPWMAFRISDTGIGISADKHEHIFELFQQEENSFTRRFGGLGIGLPTCHFLTRYLGGRMEFESTQGQGSEFRVYLPVKPMQGAPRLVNTETGHTRKLPKRRPTSQPLPNHPGTTLESDMTVLIVEDNPANMLIQCKMVERLGYRVLCASNGQEAIRLLRETPVDLILMDCQMPVMDGFEATRQIRDDDTDTSLTPIIAITANTSSLDRERCFKAGMDDHLSKPVSLAAMNLVLSRWKQRLGSSD